MGMGRGWGWGCDCVLLGMLSLLSKDPFHHPVGVLCFTLLYLLYFYLTCPSSSSSSSCSSSSSSSSSFFLFFLLVLGGMNIFVMNHFTQQDEMQKKSYKPLDLHNFMRVYPTCTDVSSQTCMITCKVWVNAPRVFFPVLVAGFLNYIFRYNSLAI